MMDGRDIQAIEAMPPRAPLELLVQDLRRHPAQTQAHRAAGRATMWRLAVFVPAILSTAGLVHAIRTWLATGGMTFVEWLLLFLIGLSFVWVCLSVSTVTAGLIALLRRARTPKARDRVAPPMSVALLVPIYNEVPWDVFGNAAAMLDDLAARPGADRYTLFILSDSRDDEIAACEWRAFEMLRDTAPAGIDVHYRRRPDNTDQKVGNIADWIEGWGADHDAMVVLDADSLMSGRAIGRLADELAADPSAGLIQSFPVLIGAETVFARIQQFSNTAYGWLLAEGLALWSEREGNYWGHNAIIRTRAFAESAGLPHLQGPRGSRRMILSHDFVEAGLLRRAGWAVRFVPRIAGSYEETPATLVDYVLRDRRWCRGNLQHLRLLASRGFHPVSRFHLLHGAVAYLLSPAWFALLVIWALLGRDADANVISYFNETNPLYPDWPVMSQTNSIVFLIFMYAMLLAPKIAAAGVIAVSPRSQRLFGGRLRFLGAFALEVALSILYAPILMVQQTMAVIRSAVGRPVGWTPQRRGGGRHGLVTLLKFHAVETALGLILMSGLAAGLVSLFLIPIAASLALAVPLSWLGGVNIAQARGALRLSTPQTVREPRIVARARAERERLRARLDQPVAVKVAAD